MIEIEPAGVKFYDDKNMASLAASMPVELNGEARNVDA